jgi:hypothetical protein
MLTRPMTDADAEEVSALILRSYDRVLVHYHSPEMLARFRVHATPESLIEQLGRKEVFVVEDAGRIVATGGLGWFDDPVRPRAAQAKVYEQAAGSRNAVSFYERAGFALDPDPPGDGPEFTWLVRPVDARS